MALVIDSPVVVWIHVQWEERPRHPQVHKVIRHLQKEKEQEPIEQFSYDHEKWFRCVRYLFYQPMDEKIKTWPLRFPAKENLNMEKALFDWPIVLQYDVKAKFDWFLESSSGMTSFQPSVRLTNQNPLAFVFVRQTNQITLFLLVCCFWDCFVRAFLFQGHTKMALYVPQLFLVGIVTGDAPVSSLLANLFSCP